MRAGVVGWSFVRSSSLVVGGLFVCLFGWVGWLVGWLFGLVGELVGLVDRSTCLRSADWRKCPAGRRRAAFAGMISVPFFFFFFFSFRVLSCVAGALRGCLRAPAGSLGDLFACCCYRSVGMADRVCGASS